MMPTLRRLDDGTRYYFLTWRQWLAALAGGGLLYAAVRFSPLSQKWTFTAALLLLATVAVAIMPLTGNALGPGSLPRRDRPLDTRPQAFHSRRPPREIAARRCAAVKRPRRPRRRPR